MQLGGVGGAAQRLSNSMKLALGGALTEVRDRVHDA